jgi:hypothetical protein
MTSISLDISGAELLESEAFDYKMASIRILGQDMAKICNPDTRAEIKTILTLETSESSKFRLITHMMSRAYGFDPILALLLKLTQGFLEIE